MKTGSVKLTHESIKKFNSKELLGCLKCNEGEDKLLGRRHTGPIATIYLSFTFLELLLSELPFLSLFAF